MEQVQNMVPIENIMDMIPGIAGNAKMKDVKVDPKELVKVKAIIDSMTVKERRNPKLLNGSRRRRIAAGSGTTLQDVNRLVKQFEQTRKMMKTFSKGLFGGGKKKFKFPFMGM